MIQTQSKLETLYRQLRKSEYGMTRPVFDLIVAALIKEGYLLGYKGITPVDLEMVQLPLSRAVDTIALGQMIEPGLQTKVKNILSLLFDRQIEDYNITIQEDLWQRLKKFRTKLERALQEVKLELLDLDKDFSESSDNLSETNNILKQIRELAFWIDPQLPSKTGLERFIAQINDQDTVHKLMTGFARIYEFIKKEKPNYLETKRYLENPALTIPETKSYSDLMELQQGVMQRLVFSDNLILSGGIERLKEVFAAFQDRYIEIYKKEHQKGHRSIDIKKIEEIRQSVAYQTLQNFSKISHLSVPDDFEKIDSTLSEAVLNYCVLVDELDLKSHPRCRCNFEIGSSPQKISTKSIDERIQATTEKYLQTLQNDEFIRPRIKKYMETMIDLEKDIPAGELTHLLNLDQNQSYDHLSEQLHAVLRPNVIQQINRALQGIKIVDRNLTGFIDKVEGGLHNKNGLLKLFEEWLEGDSQPIEGDTLIKIIRSDKP